MKTSKKIIIYNWAPFDDKDGRGGGVSVYLKSVIPFYLSAGYKIAFISSGSYYNLLSKKVYYKRTWNIYEDQGVRSYKIVNSPIKAPAIDSFFSIEECLNNNQAADVVLDCMSHIGQVDEIHFHSIEGISTILIEEIKTRGLARVVVWLHNYHWICPQVELFKDDRFRCANFNDGFDCVGCQVEYRQAKRHKTIQALIDLLDTSRIFRGVIGNWLKVFFRIMYVSGKSTASAIVLIRDKNKIVNAGGYEERSRSDSLRLLRWKESATIYALWRSENLRRLNCFVDLCVAVSGIAGRKYTEMGLNRAKLRTVPLGMDIYNSSYIDMGKEKASRIAYPIRIGFIGYSKEAKGLSFFIKTLMMVKKELSQYVNIYIASKLTSLMQRKVLRLTSKYNVTVVNGYNRSELPKLAESVDIVIVPSIWWETFNQVAYEMLMQGIPVIVSDTTGISEYINSDYVFRSGSKKSLEEKITKIIEEPQSLINYWKMDRFSLNSLHDHFRIVNTL